MDMGIRGRVALVCGASSGLGKAVSRALAREGARVAMCARTPEKLEKAVEELRKETQADLAGFAADVSVPGQVKMLIEKTVAHFGKLEILVCNAGGPPFGLFVDQPEDAWQKAVELNLLSTVH